MPLNFSVRFRGLAADTYAYRLDQVAHAARS